MALGLSSAVKLPSAMQTIRNGPLFFREDARAFDDRPPRSMSALTCSANCDGGMKYVSLASLDSASIIAGSFTAFSNASLSAVTTFGSALAGRNMPVQALTAISNPVSSIVVGKTIIEHRNAIARQTT